MGQKPILWCFLSLGACSSKPPPTLGDVVQAPVLWDPGAGPIFAAAGGSTSTSGGLAIPTAALGDDPATCEEAKLSKSYVGCDYYPTVVANVVWSIFDFAVVVANAGTTTANVNVTGPAGTNLVQTVAPDSLAKIYLPWVPELKGDDANSCGDAVPLTASVVAKAAAYHLTSDVPVTVYQFNALEFGPKGGPPGKSWSSCPGLQSCMGGVAGCWSYSNDSSLLLPSTAMTGTYRVTGHAGESVEAPDGTITPFMNTYIAITATQPGTNVTVHLSPTGSVLAGGGVPATPAIPDGGATIQLTLDPTDVAELASDLGNGVDLSGSLVTADQPVQVIAGSPCAFVPENVAACDHLEQSMFPAETLGTQYVVTVPSGPRGRPVGHVVRFYGNNPAGTTLTYSTAPMGCSKTWDLVADPNNLGQLETQLYGCLAGQVAPVALNCPTTLDAGQVAECDGIVTGDFEVEGTNEFVVGSFMLGGTLVDPGGEGDPSESLMVSVEQYRTKYVFLAPNDYDVNFADIVAPSGADVFLDGLRLNPGRLMPIGAGYGALRVPLDGINPAGNGAHVIVASAPVGLQVLGYGPYTSYQYPGGLNLKAIAPPPPR